MKKLSATLLSLTALVIIITSCSCKKHVDPPAPTPDPTPTITITLANITQTSVDVTIAATGQTSLSVTGPGGFAKSAPGTYTITGLTASTSYTVYGTASNATKSASDSKSFTTLALPMAEFTATDLSTTAATKALQGNDVAAAIKINVTKAGPAILETLGALIGGASPISQFWITSRDSSEFFQMTSTLNPVLAKTVVNASQTIQLSVGTYILCFKTAAYSGKTPGGGAIGLKLTGSNGSVANASFTADVTKPNLANVVKVVCKTANGKTDPPGQNTGDVWSILQIIPYSDEAGTIYDGNLYPSILSVSFDTKSTTWFTGTTSGYSNLDFTNALGSAGQNLGVSQDNNGTGTSIFQNTQASFSSGILQFSANSGVKLVKSFLGNYSYCSTFANVYNTGTTFGPGNVSWYLKSIKFVGNPEIWIVDPSGNRIW